jgi:hypothetical protein
MWLRTLKCLGSGALPFASSRATYVLDYRERLWLNIDLMNPKKLFGELKTRWGFFNFLPNFARHFPEKDLEEARDRCRLYGIRLIFLTFPSTPPPFLCFGIAPERSERSIVHADEKLTAFMGFESAIQGISEDVDRE